MSERSSCPGQGKGAISEPCARLSAGELPLTSASSEDPLLAGSPGKCICLPAQSRRGPESTSNSSCGSMKEVIDIWKGNPRKSLTELEAFGERDDELTGGGGP